MENRLEEYKAIDRPLLEVVSVIKMRSDDGTGLVAVEMERDGPDWKNVQEVEPTGISDYTGLRSDMKLRISPSPSFLPSFHPPPFFSPSLSFSLLSFNYIKLQVYNIIIGHLYALQSDHPQKSSYYSSSPGFPIEQLRGW